MPPKIISFFFIIFLSAQALWASVHGVDRANYNCSNGQSYDVATYYSGGWGSSNRIFLGLCSKGTLTQESWGWKLPESVPEVKTCQDEMGEELERCFYEFKELNEINDESQFKETDLSKIKHGNKTDDQACSQSHKSDAAFFAAVFKVSAQTDTIQKINSAHLERNGSSGIVTVRGPSYTLEVEVKPNCAGDLVLGELKINTDSKE